MPASGCPGEGEGDAWAWAWLPRLPCWEGSWVGVCTKESVEGKGGKVRGNTFSLDWVAGDLARKTRALVWAWDL
jgi:hypothetical protein